VSDPQQYIATGFFSNAEAQIVPNRLGLLKGINRVFPVHSHGRALRDDKYREYFARPGRRRGSNAQMDRQKSYLFAATLENSYGLDYVTEKVFDALRAWTVPVYLGAPNIADFVPPNSVIFVSDFGSPEELGHYLAYLSGNLTALWDRHLRWREHSVLPQRIHDLVRLHKYPLGCSICECFSENSVLCPRQVGQ